MDAFLFHSLIALTWTSCTMLNRSGKKEKKYSVENLTIPLLLVLAVGLSYMVYIGLRFICSIPYLMKAFIVRMCSILSSPFSTSVKCYRWSWVMTFL